MMQPLSIASNDYQRRVGMNMVRLGIAAFGIIMPFLLSLPGFLSGPVGPSAIRGFFSPGGLVLFEGSSLIIWLAIIVGTLFYRWPRSAIVLACVGFAFPVYGYLALGFSTDAQTAIGYLFLPVYSLPLVAIGWIAGMVVDRICQRRAAARSVEK